MPGNQFNIGNDTFLDIVGPSGPIQFNITTSFEAKPIYKDIDSVSIDGINRFDSLPAGHEGTFELDRADSTVDDFLAANEAAFYAGLNRSTMTITQTINEVNGSVSQYLYSGVTLKISDRGTWKGNEKVTVKVAFKAAFFTKVA